MLKIVVTIGGVLFLSKKILGFVGVFVVIIVALVVLISVQKGPDDEIDYEGKPFLGDESAPVNIIEFGDYLCPHCKDFNDNVFPVIQSELVQTGKAKFYYMNYPVIGPESTTSGKFSKAVYQELGDDKFWEFHDLLFANQTDESGNPNNFTDEFLEDVLEEVASSEETEQVMDVYNEGKWDEDFDDDVSIADDLGVQSTPSLYINGELFEGESMGDFIKAVEEAK